MSQNPVDHRLYVLLDPVAVDRNTLPALAVKSVAGGATLLQYRDKEADGGVMVKTSRDILAALRAAFGPSHPPLLINDRVDVASISKAQGVHLGQSDIHPRDARLILGDKAIIGRTIKHRGHAEALAHEPVDYATCGGVFGTVHKDNPDAPIGLDGLKSLTSLIKSLKPQLVVGAIAGIDANNLADVIHHGADGVALIGAVLKARDPEAAARDLRQAVDRALAMRG
jgi:thiamine-phosphate diphosphorylase